MENAAEDADIQARMGRIADLKAQRKQARVAASAAFFERKAGAQAKREKMALNRADRANRKNNRAQATVRHLERKAGAQAKRETMALNRMDRANKKADRDYRKANPVARAVKVKVVPVRAVRVPRVKASRARAPLRAYRAYDDPKGFSMHVGTGKMPLSTKIAFKNRRLLSITKPAIAKRLKIPGVGVQLKRAVKQAWAGEADSRSKMRAVAYAAGKYNLKLANLAVSGNRPGESSRADVVDAQRQMMSVMRSIASSRRTSVKYGNGRYRDARVRKGAA